MKYTIATVAAIAGICSAVPLTAEKTDDSHQIVCYTPHKTSTFCGDLLQNFDWMSGKKTQSADATWDTKTNGDAENVKLCFPPEHKKKSEKCYNAKPLEGSALLHSALVADFKGKITLVIGNQVFLISVDKDLIDSKEKRDAQAATPPASTSAAPLTTAQASVSRVARNGTAGANVTAPANATIGFLTSYVTKTVPSYVTYCPSATVFTQNQVVYTVTAPSLVTITSCPCTILSATVVPVATVKTISTAPFRVNNGTAPQGTAGFSGTGVAVVTATAACPTCPVGNGNAVSNNGAAFGTGVSGVFGNNGNGAAFPTGAGINNGASNSAVDASNGTATNANSNTGAGSNAATGSNAVGSNAAGSNAAGSNAAGSNAAGSNAAGSNAAGSNAAANAATNAAQSNAGAVGASANAASPTNAAESNAGAVSASTTAGSNNAQATNSDVSLFQGAAPGSPIPGTVAALVAVAVAAFFL